MSLLLRRLLGCALLSGFLLSGPMTGPATATAIFPTVVIGDLELPPANVAQVGALEVSLTSTSPVPISLAGFQLSLSLTGPDDAVKFTGAIAPQTKPYIFASDSPGPLYSISNNGRQLTFGDFLNTGFGQVVTDIGLATIQVLVEVAAMGKSYGVEISTDPVVSFLSIDNRTVVPFNVSNASIRPAPEPSAIVVGLAFALVGIALRRRATDSQRGCSE